MTAEWSVHSALVASFVGLALGPTAYEEREFTPPASNVIWYALFNLPAGRTPDSLGDAGQDDYAGVFQIDVNGPIGEGVRSVIDAAGAITAFYTAGKRIVSGAQTVTIRKSELSQPRKDDVRLTVSVSVYWSSMISRS